MWIHGVKHLWQLSSCLLSLLSLGSLLLGGSNRNDVLLLLLEDGRNVCVWGRGGNRGVTLKRNNKRNNNSFKYSVVCPSGLQRQRGLHSCILVWALAICFQCRGDNWLKISSKSLKKRNGGEKWAIRQNLWTCQFKWLVAGILSPAGDVCQSRAACLFWSLFFART